MKANRYKFRGKRTDNGEWVYGYLTHLTGMSKECIKQDGYYISDECGRQPVYLIEENTVGQFTGLYDRNGKEVYEGDIPHIVTEDGEKINVVCRFGSVRRTMNTGYLCEIVGFYFERPDGLKSFPIVCNYMGLHDTQIMEIIGNIHDNPDLLTTNKRL